VKSSRHCADRPLASSLCDFKWTHLSFRLTHCSNSLSFTSGRKNKSVHWNDDPCPCGDPTEIGWRSYSYPQQGCHIFRRPKRRVVWIRDVSVGSCESYSYVPPTEGKINGANIYITSSFTVLTLCRILLG
jgi:hypothetical protein